MARATGTDNLTERSSTSEGLDTGRPEPPQTLEGNGDCVQNISLSSSPLGTGLHQRPLDTRYPLPVTVGTRPPHSRTVFRRCVPGELSTRLPFDTIRLFVILSEANPRQTYSDVVSPWFAAANREKGVAADTERLGLFGKP